VTEHRLENQAGGPAQIHGIEHKGFAAKIRARLDGGPGHQIMERTVDKDGQHLHRYPSQSAVYGRKKAHRIVDMAVCQRRYEGGRAHLNEFYLESLLAEKTLIYRYPGGEKRQRGSRVTQSYLLGRRESRV
jgi:hypothetical protein